MNIDMRHIKFLKRVKGKGTLLHTVPTPGRAGGFYTLAKDLWDMMESMAEEEHYDIFLVDEELIADLRKTMLLLEDLGGPTLPGIDVMDMDIEFIKRKEHEYKGSWKKRGGVGAFMMLARKWDRIEPQTEKYDGDLALAIKNDQRTEGILDDIRDLRCYLMLVEAEQLSRRTYA